MSLDEKQIAFYKDVANDLWSILIWTDYGSNGFQKLSYLTESITKIYKHLNFSSFSNIIIYVRLEESVSLENIDNSNCIPYRSFQNLATISGDTLTIEVQENLDVLVSVDFAPQIEPLRANAIVYQRIGTNESILGKTEQKTLKQPPNSESYFSIQTYKDLDVALEDYKVKVARSTAMCPELKTIWFDDNRIFLKPKPEHLMRNSLTYFLKLRLRTAAEVRPEQVVDESHPVDIKVTWEYSTNLALIEIKWLGKSLQNYGANFTQNYSAARALKGATQLAEYLDSNRVQAPDKVTKGYLVVFDGRRWQINSNKAEISRSNGFHFENSEIQYTPEYNKTRTDFAKPVRFFMEPNCTI